MMRLLYFLFLLTSAIGYSQTVSVADEVIKLNKSYLNHKTFSANLVYNYFDTTSTEVIDKEVGLVRLTPTSQYNKLGPIEVLIKDSVLCQVDHTSKEINLFSKRAKEQVSLGGDFRSMLTSLLETCDENKIEKISGNKNKIILKMCYQSSYPEVHIVYSTKSYEITKIILFGSLKSEVNRERLEILYTNVKINSKISSTYFNWNKYVIKRGNKYVPTTPYKLYKVTNYLSQ